ncbi:MAG: hypothetical protein COW84_00810 [Gammaproteobacteria bacterium CG22_combo_CG10-13_8_21_14_all_40_8]|nr:MAG: hypothetical protein COW84_00810 [Gammaproteobacteria bacterium CG22_combo_CG10-13_8_21_14_all_40_8]
MRFFHFKSFHLILIVGLFIMLPTLHAANQEFKTITLESGESLQLNGIGKANYMLADFYLAALYVSEPSNQIDSILQSPNAKRMQLRILAKKFSSRQFGQYWKETLSINNPKDLLQPEVDNVLKFIELFPESVALGDVINIDDTGSSTRVSINGVTIGDVKSPQFYKLVLNAWLGPRPPNDDFKINILNGHGAKLDEKLLQDFTTIQPSKDRIALYLSIIKQREEIIAKKLADEAAKALALAEQEKAKQQALELEQQKERELAEKAKQDKIAAEKERKEIEALALQQKQQAEEQKKIQGQKLAEQQKLENSVDVIREKYLNEVKILIKKQQEYPTKQMYKDNKYRRLMEKGQIASKGKFRITIDNMGKVTDAAIIKSTDIAILDRSTLQNLSNISGLPPIPENLPDEGMVFDIELDFLSPQFSL